MLKATSFFFSNLIIVFIVYAMMNFNFSSKPTENVDRSHRPEQQQNHPPVVKIMTPKNNSMYEPNAQVPYEIRVSDLEDGESKYQEINPKEVFLEIKYITDTSGLAELKQKSRNDPPGIAAIKTSNCMNCHAFKSKLIGPSFFEINKRYPHIKANTDTLAKHIREGSTGVWGNIKMPSNKELTSSQAQDIVDWIFKNAADPNLNYYAGTEGAFRPTPPPASQKGVFILTASYTDHGLKNDRNQSLKGQDVITIRQK